jgi:5-methylcytosine-specific restriction protein A
MFQIGKEYRRRDIHGQYGGQSQGGMSTPASHPIIFLFTGERGGRFGYTDTFQDDGLFWYTGEGQVGHMQFVRANKAVLDHKQLGKRIFLFEETRKAFVRYIGEAECLGYHYEQRPDRDDTPRQAIVFHLGFISPEPVDMKAEAGGLDLLTMSLVANASETDLRRIALKFASPSAGIRARIGLVRIRAEAVRRYALVRAAGRCEACGNEAPFATKRGPFLEVHHVYRVSDGGPDHPAYVAALCPNCHREVHFGMNGKTLNAHLISYLENIEGEVPLAEGNALTA